MGVTASGADTREETAPLIGRERTLKTVALLCLLACANTLLTVAVEYKAYSNGLWLDGRPLPVSLPVWFVPAVLMLSSAYGVGLAWAAFQLMRLKHAGMFALLVWACGIVLWGAGLAFSVLPVAMANPSQIDREVAIAVLRATLGIGTMWVLYLVWLAASPKTRRVLSPGYVASSDATHGEEGRGPYTWSVLAAPILGMMMVIFHGGQASKVPTHVPTAAPYPTWSSAGASYPRANVRFDGNVSSEGELFPGVWDTPLKVEEPSAQKRSDDKSTHRVSALDDLPDLGL